jgi:hypothetical protein
MWHASLGMTTLARAAAEDTVEQVRSVARWHAGRSGLWGVLGLNAALSAGVCWAKARNTGHARLSAATVVVLALYLLLCMLII